MNDRGEIFWSIGEVLSLLQDEFPEVTISKIRFLEGQGLIDPERTASGYRRFYQHDFDRLQWILTQQRDHYLPLRVIRDRLDAGEWQPPEHPPQPPRDGQMTLLAPVIDIGTGSERLEEPADGEGDGAGDAGADDDAAAQEPEIDDLIHLLQAMGADVERTAPDVIEVEGKRRLRGATHHAIADRIEAGTFAVAAAVTGGDVTLRGAPGEHLGAFLDVLHEVGVDVGGEGDRIIVRGTEPGTGRYHAADIETAAYPGLATDLQPPTGVLLSQAAGRSTVHETIYEDRLEWLSDLRRMGAQARIIDPHRAVISGPSRLQGAEVEVGDLRAGASLILGALAANGPSIIHGVHHVRRGYEGIEGKLLDLGAAIEQVAKA